jgi:nicotinic acid phosphoribosyltransferase
MELATSPMLTDLYQLNMVQAYLERGQTEIAVFEFFVRSLPNRRGFLIGAGLQQALEHLETVRFVGGHRLAGQERTLQTRPDRPARRLPVYGSCARHARRYPLFRQ